MRPGVFRVDGSEASSLHGRVVFASTKALWNLSMLVGTLVLAPMTFSLSALAVFVVLTYTTLLLGHSVGMHRRFIHRAYDCPKWPARSLRRPMVRPMGCWRTVVFIAQHRNAGRPPLHAEDMRFRFSAARRLRKSPSVR